MSALSPLSAARSAKRNGRRAAMQRLRFRDRRGLFRRMFYAALLQGFWNFAKMFPIFAVIILLEQLGPTIGRRMDFRTRLRHVRLWAAYTIGGALLCSLIMPAVHVLEIRPLLSSWSFPAGVIVALLVGDFFYYWFHRFEHRFLWRMHAVHHSSRELSGVSGYHHPAESLLQSIYWIVPVGLLVPNPFGPALLFLITMTWDQYSHSNTAFGLGRWRVIVADNRFHRIHHSLDPAHWDHNFGVLFPWWDMMFGTAWMPAPDEWPDVGVPEFGELTSPVEMIARPFNSGPARQRPVAARL
jgi:sterol desaturase/sphingolipid hydroxylase (fatty acid hydroxylase superfamily)